MPIEVVHHYRLTCSRPGCPAVMDLTGGVNMGAAREAGWEISLSSNDPDLCPDHGTRDDDPESGAHFRTEISDGQGGLIEIKPGDRLAMIGRRRGDLIHGFVFEWAYMDTGAVHLVMLDPYARRVSWMAAGMAAVS